MAEPEQQREDSSRLMSNHCATTSVVVNFLNTYLLRESWTQAWRTPPNIVESTPGHSTEAVESPRFHSLSSIKAPASTAR